MKLDKDGFYNGVKITKISQSEIFEDGTTISVDIEVKNKRQYRRLIRRVRKDYIKRK